MTDKTLEAVEVTQEDREAAAAWSITASIWTDNSIRDIERGYNDNWPIVQAFARHRIAAITAARPLIMDEAAGIVREWPSQVLTEGEQSERFQSGVRWACFHAATAIRAAAAILAKMETKHG